MEAPKMGDKQLVTFNLDVDRKEVWEEEADDRGRSLSGFIRHAGEKEIAGREQSGGGGTDHTQELEELHNLLGAVLNQTESMDETLGLIHREVSIPDEIIDEIPVVVRALPSQNEGSLTTEEIADLTGMTMLRITQALTHAEEQTKVVGHETTEDGTRQFYRKV